MTKTRTRVIEPTRKGDGFVWEGIKVRHIKGKGKGIVATKHLKVGMMYPIIGKRVPVEMYNTQHAFPYDPILEGETAIDGHPTINPYYGSGNFGLSVTMMINEPVTEKPNCLFKLNCLVVALPIQPGEELLTWYGKEYEREKYNYSLRENPYLKNQDTFDTYIGNGQDYREFWNSSWPRKRKRNMIITKWNDIVEERERQQTRTRWYS